MSILRKPLSDIALADLEELVATAARETGELEFKGTLPFKPEKGKAQVADRWIEIGDGLGNYARDEILSELVAFANADGGTLVLGIQETKEEPRRAQTLNALPRCDDLARRLVDAAEDTIEPRLPVIGARAILAAEGSDEGYVSIRVGKSLAGPHRLRTTREFYIRRGERAAKMDVREIKDLTLSLARTGDRIEQLFQERQEFSRGLFKRVSNSVGLGEIGPLVVRATAMPTTVQVIPQITSRPDLWWKGRRFQATIGSAPYDCEYPAREFDERPRVRLRAFEILPDPEHGGVYRLLRGDGAAEFALVHPKRESNISNAQPSARVYMGWILGVVAGAISQAQFLRQHLAWDGVEYGLEVELWSQVPLTVRWQDDFRSEGALMSGNLMPFRLPRYSITSPAENNALITALVRDIMNSSGREWSKDCEIPWHQLVPTP